MKNIGVIGGSNYWNKDSLGTNMAFMTALLAKAQETEKRMSPEERAHRDELRQISQETSRINRSIQSGCCPICTGKLVRGKKGKDNIRVWECPACKKYFSKI